MQLSRRLARLKVTGDTIRKPMNRFESKDTAPASTTPAAIAAAADALATFACWYQGPNSHKADSTKFPKDNSDDL